MRNRKKNKRNRNDVRIVTAVYIVFAYDFVEQIAK